MVKQRYFSHRFAILIVLSLFGLAAYLVAVPAARQMPGVAAESRADTRFSAMADGSFPPLFLLAWGKLNNGEGQFNFPEGVAVDADGNVFVTDRDNQRIQKFDHNGNFLLAWGSYGSSNGQFNLPGGIAVDAGGDIFISDTGNHRIQKFGTAGSFLQLVMQIQN